MQVVCAKCSRALEYSGDCPSFCAYCGQSLREVPHSTPSVTDTDATQDAGMITQVMPGPQMVAGYRLGRVLGTGGMGTVYEAEEVATGRRVALKLIKPEYAGSSDAVERFRQEGRIASMVAHPRCVFVQAVDEEAGRPYIVMELMPGHTLKEVVSEQGPLPPEEALAKILDVIEGLQAAHRLEVIHRDVKPSNCFLEADGRVKVGDFGLAKSLVRDAHITRTGAFVGTPHFASPEQIRSEPIDRQTDVYSVAATLYYLLTGQPPFAGHDSAATLARIVSEPAPPLRSLRPELSPALEQVIQRGLERDRDRRWPDLEALRQALLSLAPEPLPLEGQVKRVAAYAVDGLLFGLVYFALGAGLSALFGDGSTLHQARYALLGRGVSLLLFFLYFMVLEHRWGASLGKQALGLRVCTRQAIDLPGWGATALRTLVFLSLTHLGLLLAALLLSWDRLARTLLQDAAELDLFLAGGWNLLGIAILVSTMRARNGYLGLHEIASGTRVVQPVRPRPRDPARASGGWLVSVLHGRRMNQGTAQPAALPQRLGGFAIRGALKWTPSDKVLLGEDASLGRRAILWLRPVSAPPLPAARRDIGRRTRLRWLGSGQRGELQWDAMLAPLGSPLPEFLQSEGALAWREARLLLEELAGELAAAIADDTLPATLELAQVWVQEDGRVQLADLPLTPTPAEEKLRDGTAQERAMDLLERVAARAVQRAPRSAAARQVCERLLGVGKRYESVPQVQEDLRQS